MCGICGIAGAADLRVIEAMTKIMTHRGPDDSGVVVFEEGRAALGHTRLSIIDLSSRGHQPMSDASRRFWITYNGEIYNYREIRGELIAKGRRFTTETDTEVALCAYQQWGDDFLKKLNGMFALAIWRPNGVGFELHLNFQLFNVTAILGYTLAFVAVMLAIEYLLVQPIERHSTRWRNKPV